MKKLSGIILLLSFSEAFGQQPSCYEQIALNFFEYNICPKEFSKRKISLISKISEPQSGSVFKICFPDYYVFYSSLDDSGKKNLIKEQKLYDSVDVTKVILKAGGRHVTSTSSDKIKPGTLVVRKADTYKFGYYFVEILVYEKDLIWQFGVEIDKKTEKVTRSCKNSIMY